MRKFIAAIGIITLFVWSYNGQLPFFDIEIAEAALTVDATSNSGNKTAADPWDWSHTVTGSDTILVVAVNSYTALPTDVTYNSVSLTSDAGASISNGSFNSSVWYLINPTTGTNTVSVDFASTNYGEASAISFTGAHQTTQPDAVAEESGTSSSTNSLSITTVADNAFIVDAISVDTTFAGSLTENGAQTNLHNAGPSFIETGGSYKDPGSGGAQTMIWTWSASFAEEYAHAAISVNPAADSTRRVILITMLYSLPDSPTLL